MKVIHNSNLALRFYLRYRWTIEELNSCCIKGEAYLPFPDDVDPYFVFKVGTVFDAKKLLTLGTVHRTFDDYPQQTDEEFLNNFNWG